MKPKSRLWFWFIVPPLVLFCTTAFLIQRQIRQERLDRFLIASLSQEDAESALRLIRQGASPHAVSQDQNLSFLDHLRIALHLQARSNQADRPYIALHQVLDKICQFSREPRLQGRTAWHIVLEAMLEHGADPNIPDAFNPVNRYTPLIKVTYSGDVVATLLLLKHGADVNRRGLNKLTPLLAAVDSGALEILQLLLQHGADVNQRGLHDVTPLHRAMGMSCTLDGEPHLKCTGSLEAQPESGFTLLSCVHNQTAAA